MRILLEQTMTSLFDRSSMRRARWMLAACLALTAHDHDAVVAQSGGQQATTSCEALLSLALAAHARHDGAAR